MTDQPLGINGLARRKTESLQSKESCDTDASDFGAIWSAPSKNSVKMDWQELVSQWSEEAAKVPGLSVMLGSIGVAAIWLLLGSFWHFSSAWSVVTTIATALITFLMVFLMRDTHNRESEALHHKLDTLIRQNRYSKFLLELDELPQEDLKALKEKLRLLAGNQQADTTEKGITN